MGPRGRTDPACSACFWQTSQPARPSIPIASFEHHSMAGRAEGKRAWGNSATRALTRADSSWYHSLWLGRARARASASASASAGPAGAISSFSHRPVSIGRVTRPGISGRYFAHVESVGSVVRFVCWSLFLLFLVVGVLESDGRNGEEIFILQALQLVCLTVCREGRLGLSLAK